MFRAMKLGAIVVMVTVVGAPAANAADRDSSGQQTQTWGVFRERADRLNEDQRNCWAQAMVSGQTINGEIMAERVTEQKAQNELVRLAQRGLCASARTSASWTARAPKHNHDRDSDTEGVDDGG
jgi:hypothetical protein